MLRKLLGAGLLLATLAGCKGLDGTCTSDSDCTPGGLCNTDLGICYSAGTEPELDGGECTFTCAEYQACTKNGCNARFSELAIQTPDGGALLGVGPIQVIARLEAVDTYKNTTRFPPGIHFGAELVTGGLAGGFSGFTHDDAGTYSTVWTPPAIEAQVELRAAHLDPDAGLSDTVIVRVDAVPPVFDVTVPPASTSASDGGTTYADPDAGSLTNLWRRDQQVPIEIRTNEPNLDLTSLKVALVGTDGTVAQSVSVTPASNCVSVFCGVALVNLWEPTFNTFRGPMALKVEGMDLAGNVGTTSPSTPHVDVTRWKWAFTLPTGTIKASPAIGDKGTVYIGASDGKVIALTSEGTKNWEAQTVGAVGSVAVGASDGGVEFIYAAANSASTKAVLYALSSDDGGVKVRCPGTAEHDGPVVGTMAVTATGNPPNRFESGVAIVNNGANSQLWAVRPEAMSSSCIPSNVSAVMAEANAEGSLIANGSTFFYPTTATSIVSYTYGSNALDWTATTGTHLVVGLAFTGGKLIGGGGGASFTQGALYSVPATSNPTASPLTGTGVGRVWNPIIGPVGTSVFYGQETSSTQGDLKRYDLANTTVANTNASVGVFKYASALGADGLLYTAPSSASLVSVVSANDLSARWSVALNGASTASLGLDCARSTSGAVVRGMPGTLYVPAGGTLHAIIVDSPGLSRDSAAWPKFQHDARNTGNPATIGPNCQ